MLEKDWRAQIALVLKIFKANSQSFIFVALKFCRSKENAESFRYPTPVIQAYETVLFSLITIHTHRNEKLLLLTLTM